MTRPAPSGLAVCKHCRLPITKRSGQVWSHAAGWQCITAACCGSVAVTMHAASDGCECGRGAWGEWRTATPADCTVTIPQAREEDGGTRRPSAEARRIGLRAMVTVGCKVWTDPDLRATAGAEGVGGVVVQIDEEVDVETGETERVYITLDPYRRGLVRRVRESEVAQVDVGDSTTLARMARGLCERNGSCTGPVTPDEARAAEWARRLYGTVMGG